MVGWRDRKTRVGQDALSFSVPKRKMKSKLKSRHPWKRKKVFFGLFRIEAKQQKFEAKTNRQLAKGSERNIETKRKELKIALPTKCGRSFLYFRLSY
jgi:hypothetical protein